MNVSKKDYPLVVFALTNFKQLSNPCALHRNFGFILCKGDTSVAGPAEVNHNPACSQFIVSNRIANMPGDGHVSVQAVTLLSAEIYFVRYT